MRVNVKARPARDKPRAMAQTGSMIWLTDAQGFRDLSCQGYTSLADSPEVSTAVNTIARLIGAMTIHEMENTPRGDVRIRNRISELVDIEPNRYMTRSNFIQWVVRTMFLQGRGNAVVFPRTERGELRELIPIPAAYAAFVPAGTAPLVSSVLMSVIPAQVAGVKSICLATSHTEKGFMSSKWKPSIIVKVDAIDEELSKPEGRQKILDSYVRSGEAGEPWLIPAEQFDVKEIRPLTLSDLALADFVKLDKQTVATILGVPPFVLGVGEFKRDEWNNFISTTIMPIAQIIEQELTRKLLPQGDRFFRFNARSLHNYSMDEMVKAGAEMVDRMAMRRNEWRDWMGLEPDPDMDELLALENYIPADRLGDQKKLTGGDA